MVEALAAYGLLWPVIIETVVVCMIGIFIWGLLEPAKRRVLLKVLWGSAILAVLLTLPLVLLVA